MAKQKELNEKLIDTLKTWQVVEDESVRSTSEIISKTKNPVVKQVMEIIRQDSAMHKKVQQLLIDNFEKEAFSLTPEELAGIWNLVEKHIELEKETIRLAEESRRNTKNFVIRYLLGYLMTDEQKHNLILQQLEDIKLGIYPYA
jgi:hydroxymethylpyrimidine/phosphomethylpyrimidine kinase